MDQQFTTDNRQPTTSGQRPAASSVLSPQSSVLTQTEASLLGFWQNIFADADIGVHDDFFVLGGHSLLSARISARVKDLYGLELPLSQVIETPTVAELAAYIDAQLASERETQLPPSSSLVRLKPGHSRPPVYCMHTFLGGIGDYLPLARQFGPEQPVYAVQGQGLVNNELPASSIEGMAAHCVREIRKLQPHGPYHLVGASFAGLVAVEAARQLRAQGESVPLVALLDTWLPYRPGRLQLGPYLRRFAHLQKLRVTYHLGRQRRIARSQLIQLGPLSPRERLRFISYKGKLLRQWLRGGRRRERGKTPDGGPREILELDVSHNRMLHASNAAMLRYRPAPYGGRVVYFYALDRSGAPPFDQRRAWSYLARGGLEVISLPGNHHAVLGESNVGTVARALEERIER